MFRFVVLLCVFVAAAYGKPGILGSSVSIAAAPAIVSAPSISVVRTAPIATIGAPLTLSSGLVSNGLVSNGLIANGLVSGGLISGGLVSGGLVSSGIINGGLVTSGKVITKGLI
ncbi:uncharacterized protein LOC129948415 [Eupeodes corollae]|uniref:uncharacterized protein LOC129948415 n=1 Tax=Eupeodes corollae TaxID=290404 RepID=UPI00249044BA|nr:uncharacterized protein LOC129948415 [Eupeodes corollae]